MTDPALPEEEPEFSDEDISSPISALRDARDALRQSREALRLERERTQEKLTCPICNHGPDCSGNVAYTCSGCWHDRQAEHEAALASAREREIPEDARDRIMAALATLCGTPPLREHDSIKARIGEQADAVLSALRPPSSEDERRVKP